MIGYGIVFGVSLILFQIVMIVMHFRRGVREMRKSNKPLPKWKWKMSKSLYFKKKYPSKSIHPP